MPRRAAIKAVVPLTAIALVGLTACQKSDDAKSTPSASVSASAGKDKSADAAPATDDQLSAVLLDGKDIPAGYTGGKVTTERQDKSNLKTTPAECGVLNGINGPEPVGYAERSYATGGKDPEGDDSVQVSLSTASRDKLKTQFDSAVAALKTCAQYNITKGTDAPVTTVIVDVKNAPFGKDSVTYRVSLVGAQHQGLAVATITVVLKGTTGMSVMSIAAVGEPADPTPFVTTQLAKLDALAKGGATDKPKSSAKPSSSATPSNGKNQPSTEALTTALLNKQEIPAEYEARDPSTDRPTEESKQVSDSRCAKITQYTVERAATGYVEQAYAKPAPSGGQSTEGVFTWLASQSNAFLMQEFDNYVTALKACPAFTETASDGTVDKYTITDVTTGNYTPDSVTFRVRDDNSKDGRAYLFVVVAVQGTVMTQVQSVATNGPAVEPTNMITGQLDKVAALTR
ncbi:hypothetical protein ACPA54_28405 [Uniformispora flossi]|uniref:hypothetical protein n=1 Tax=Uniformispora flossi TaxID=3390723 RepID=UPI003C30BEBE